jgi:2-dehydro-3-deoxyphosphogluconate aldolase/(4S)-4-hydroxy-2-oxoglutarate aldolase
MNDALSRIEALQIVPVISIEHAADAPALGEALLAGGLPIAEITFRTDAAEASIRALARRGELLVGAGTVLNVQTAQRALNAGAKFIVSPGFNPKVVSWCLKAGVPIMPGVATPTDVEMALEHGLSAVKFFPAEALGGLKMLKAIAAPFAMMRFVPTGGIDAANLGEYLRFPSVLACGGSWMVSKEILAERRFDQITCLARDALNIAQAAKPSK